MSNKNSNDDDLSLKRYQSQVHVLQSMIPGNAKQGETRQFHIHEIVEITGKDEKEVQRSLYVLEGHKFVAPFPPGDFTSKTWSVTETGIKAAKMLKKSNMTLL
ncbi:MAG: hypothetical protein KDD62_10700 [Bdellovibrionales bacterium]|nr:hypothetical protein [Bdellovibrionales bacterium]